MRSVAIANLGDASWTNQELEEAREAFAMSANVARAAGNIGLLVLATSNLVGVLVVDYQGGVTPG